MKYIAAAAIFSLIIVSGCTSTTSEGLSLSLQADPARVFSGSTTTLHMDVDNRDSKALYNVLIKLFDSETLKTVSVDNGGNVCEKRMERMLPSEFQTLSCILRAPAVLESKTAKLNALVSFQTSLSATQIFEMMNEKEYERRVASNDFASASKSYVYSDRNVQIQVEFSSMPPLVIVPDRKYYVYFTIRNIGQGFLGDINPGDLVFRSTDSRAPIDFLRCQYPTAVLPITEKSSPKIACEIIAPGDYFTTRNFGTGSFVIELNYKYELRRDLSVDIVK